jgi:hypothetical protein
VSYQLKLFGVCLLLFASVPIGLAQATQPTPQKSCEQPEFRQFDFWLGEWQATWPGSKPDEIQHGRNRIRKVLGDCVVEEQFDGADAIGLRGMSVSTYVPAAKKWKQTWVDSQGGYLDFVGEFSGGQMVLARHGLNPQGQEIDQRMVYKNIKADAFDWSWERSTDGGKTWNVLWPIHYTRAKQ